MTKPPTPTAPPVLTINRTNVIAPTKIFPYGWFQRFFNAIYRLIGWKVVGNWPQLRKFVFIAAPHTSNWDMPIGLCAGFASGILRRWPYGFMMKDVMFWGPLGPIMRLLGGLSIDRRSPHDVVHQMTKILEERDQFVLAITPEGTRSRRDYWKSGFYHIALGANVPIVPVAFDYATKEVGLGEPMMPTGNAEADIAVLRHFFENVTPKRPENFGPIRFRPSGMRAGANKEE